MLFFIFLCYFNKLFVNSAILKQGKVTHKNNLLNLVNELPKNLLESKENVSKICMTQDCVETGINRLIKLF